MKKLVILILTCCLGQTGIVKAADTDVSGISNVIYIPHFEVQPGTTEFELSIHMKNAAAIRGFQFDLELPTGITPTLEDDEMIYWLNATRSPKKGGGQYYHSLEVSQQTDGTYRFLCGAQQDKTFKGNDGEILVFQINVASGMATGDYAIRLKNVKLTETDINNYYETELVESTVTVSNSPRTILNETSTTAPASAANANVRVNRTIKGGEWSTICLPFDMTAAQVKSAFGNDVELADFTGYDATKDGDDVTGITINFAEATAIAKNHPYIIKVASTVSSFTADGVAISVGTPTVNIATGKSFVGTYVAETVIPQNGLFLNNNQFWYSKGATKMKGYRAYFSFADVLASASSANARITMNFNEATGIQDNNRETTTNNRYFDLQGRSVENPGKGIYLKNGKKVVVK